MNKYHVAYTISVNKEGYSENIKNAINLSRSEFREALERIGAEYTVDTTFRINIDKDENELRAFLKGIFHGICKRHNSLQFCTIELDIFRAAFLQKD